MNHLHTFRIHWPWCLEKRHFIRQFKKQPTSFQDRRFIRQFEAYFSFKIVEAYLTFDSSTWFNFWKVSLHATVEMWHFMRQSLGSICEVVLSGHGILARIANVCPHGWLNFTTNTQEKQESPLEEMFTWSLGDQSGTFLPRKHPCEAAKLKHASIPLAC